MRLHCTRVCPLGVVGTTGPPLSVDQVHDQLVGGHHDGRVGDLPDQVGGQPPVQPGPALLPVHQLQALPEGAVLVPWLSQSSTDYLCKWGGGSRREQEGAGRSRKEQEGAGRSTSVKLSV